MHKSSLIGSLSMFGFFGFVDRIVIRVRHHNKIFRTIVSSVSVYVVNKFVLVQFSFEHLFHNISMFKNVGCFSDWSNISISVSRFMANLWSNFSPPKFLSAWRRACLAFGMFCDPFLFAKRTFSFKHSFVHCPYDFVIKTALSFNDFHLLPPFAGILHYRSNLVNH